MAEPQKTTNDNSINVATLTTSRKSNKDPKASSTFNKYYKR
jgi:hypothetical protein